MAADFKDIFETEKAFTIRPSWVLRDSEGLEVVCPLEIDGVNVEGLQFRATARLRHPDEFLTFQVELHPASEPGGPLARIEWRPLSPHNNKGIGPQEWQNRIIAGCHHHPFDLNMQFAEKEMRKGRLPVALPLTDSPSIFQDLLGFVGKEFRISNMAWVLVPPWEPILV